LLIRGLLPLLLSVNLSLVVTFFPLTAHGRFVLLQFAAVQTQDVSASVAFHKAKAALEFAEEQHGGAGR
jgi:hypothetical protein